MRKTNRPKSVVQKTIFALEDALPQTRVLSCQLDHQQYTSIVNGAARIGGNFQNVKSPGIAFCAELKQMGN